MDKLKLWPNFLWIVLCYLVQSTACQAQTALMQPEAPLCALNLVTPPTMVVGQDEVNKALAEVASPSRLEGATLSHCTVTISFAGRDIQKMKFLGVSAPGVNFSGGIQAQGATFSDTDLRGANLSNGSFQSAQFNGITGSLSNATMTGDTFQAANFQRHQHDWCESCRLHHGRTRLFLPTTSQTRRSWLRLTADWRTMRSPGNRIALVQLRKQFSDMGLDDRMRDISLAIGRDEQADDRQVCITGKELGGRRIREDSNSVRFESCLTYAVRAVALDATCAFGRSPWRPVGIVLALGLLWALLLGTALQFAKNPGIIMVFKTRKGEEWIIPAQRLVSRAYVGGPRRVLARYRIAAALSLASVFNVPFKDVDVGKWLHMLSARDYDFRIQGWIRVVAGYISLVCFYLLTIWVLSFFEGSFLA